MPLTLDAIVRRIQGQFDAHRDDIAAWANERLSRMVSESLWRAVEREVGVTRAGQAVYPLEPEMVDLRGLRVGAAQYGSASREQMWALQDPTCPATLVGAGVYAPTFDADGNAAIELWPVPSREGVRMTALMAYEPPLLVGGEDVPALPAHFHSYLLDWVIATAYEELDGRWDLADPHERRFEVGIQRLERERVSRYQGGPVQAQVAGYHFRLGG